MTTEEEQKRCKKIFTDINGLTVKLTDGNNNTWDCIVLASPIKGISFKPIASAKHIRKKTGSNEVSKWSISPEDKRFCFLRLKPKYLTHYINIYEDIIETKKLNVKVFGLVLSGASCPF